MTTTRPTPKPRPVPRPRQNTINSNFKPNSNNNNNINNNNSENDQNVDTSSIPILSVPIVKPRPPARNPKPPDEINPLKLLRRSIEQLIRSNRPQKEKFEAACEVMKVECPLNTKYEIVDLRDILQLNKVHIEFFE